MRRPPESLFLTDARANLAPHLLMIAGGTGITPMYQIIQSSIKDASDKTKLSLIYANVEEDDICTYSHLDPRLRAKSSAAEGAGGPRCQVQRPIHPLRESTLCIRMELTAALLEQGPRGLDPGRRVRHEGDDREAPAGRRRRIVRARRWAQGLAVRPAAHDDRHEVSDGLGGVYFEEPGGVLIVRGHLKELGYPAPRSVSKLEDQVFLF